MARTTPLAGVATTVRKTVAQSTLSLFDHAEYPLKNTLDHAGDPGLLGPGSVSWIVLADPAAFVGGMRGLLIQAAHPEVVAGVGDHSRYRSDPFGRLSRTSSYVTATTYGAMPEVDQAVEQVKRFHRIVSGVSERGRPYDAGDPELSAWVHNALTNSFLVAHQHYGEYKLSAEEADQFVEEQTAIGRLLGSNPMPKTSASLDFWVSEHPDAGRTQAMADVVDFLKSPPLTPGVRAGYSVILEAAIATIPSRLRDILGVDSRPGAEVMGRTVTASLRWALGFSPSWALALQRMGIDRPSGLFKQDPESRIAS